MKILVTAVNENQIKIRIGKRVYSIIEMYPPLATYHFWEVAHMSRKDWDTNPNRIKRYGNVFDAMNAAIRGEI